MVLKIDRGKVIKPKSIYDCIILGGGPAGLTAALYLARFKRKFLIIDDKESRAKLIPISHNYPGTVKGISGTKILAKLRSQLKPYQPKYVHNTAIQIQKLSSFFRVKTKRSAYFAQTIILATGLIDREPVLPRLKNSIKCGLIRHCPICDAYEAANKNIAIICDRHSGIKQAFFMRRYSNRITVLTLGCDVRLSKKERDAFKQLGIKLIKDPVIEVVISHNKIKLFKMNQQSYNFDYVYSALGTSVRSELATEIGAKYNKDKSILVNNKQETNIRGLYAIGDVVAGLNQICVGMGHAAIAATSINETLSRR